MIFIAAVKDIPNEKSLKTFATQDSCLKRKIRYKCPNGFFLMANFISPKREKESLDVDSGGPIRMPRTALKRFKTLIKEH